MGKETQFLQVAAVLSS